MFYKELFGEKFATRERMEAAPNVFLKLLSSQTVRPKGIDIMQEFLYDLMNPVLSRIGINLHLVNELPMIDEAEQGLLEYI